MTSSRPTRPAAGRSGRSPAVALALAWLAHPVTVLATVVLAVNDHLLKAAFPGLVTGKLSDVAGLVMAPPIVALALAAAAPRLRPPVCAIAAMTTIGAGFAGVKASPLAAGYASAAWSLVNGASTIQADPTDLLALPVLGLAWLSWRGARTRPASRRLVRLVALAVVLPSAALALAATSAPYDPTAVSITQWRGATVLGIASSVYDEPHDHLVSRDGGRTLSRLSDAEHEALRDEEPAPAPAGPTPLSGVRIRPAAPTEPTDPAEHDLR